MTIKSTNIVLFPDRVQEELFETLDDVFYYAITYFKEQINSIIESLFSGMKISSQLEDEIFSQLIYWSTYCLPIGAKKETIYQHYLQANKEIFEYRSLKVREVLASWLHLNPSFYYVEKSDSLSGRVFVLLDVFNEQSKIVCIYNRKFQAPKRGELISGLLMPMGDDTYTTLGGLIHLPGNNIEHVVNEMIAYAIKHRLGTSLENRRMLYPVLLLIALKQMASDK
ncbi:hypothetical protein [Oceanobacillus chungangensis]|uniref:Uncharacterized protein n=1 Tax=Oceanobacillus chungangensis TaxID=1229152 RepID=A0A3D8PX56_9BACI|nr:hypothetical protein [Oceanobacillus chungangensis]RDW19719.1 hypothetical protein CWR45_06485 [Oceanobacillus chungangensis]